MFETLKLVFSDKSLKKNRSLLMLTIIVVLLGFASVSMAGRAIYNYHESLQIKDQIEQMKREIANYQQKNAQLNSQPYKPVTMDKVDHIQANMLLAIQACNLKMQDYKAENFNQSRNSNQGVSYQSFNVSFEGSYENTMRFLQNFGDKDALMNLMEVDMSPENGKIKTNINYRIYTR